LVYLNEKAPDFKLLDTDLKLRSLSEFVAKGRYVVLVFFPGAFTLVCTKELCSFRDRMSVLNKLDAEVVAISTDSPFTLRVFKELNKLNFTLLSDYNREVIELYDAVLPQLGNLPLKKLAKRAVIIVDPENIVRYRWVSEDPGIEPNYDEIEDILRKLREGLVS
jgi:peroxiredoxin